MNCDTCTEKFTTVNDLMQHVYSIKHNYRCSHFFCIPCSQPLFDLANVIQHVGSAEHSLMAIATGIHFDIKSEHSDDHPSPTFPPLFCCLLCGTRDDNASRHHMKSSTHKKMASLMRGFIRFKTIQCSEKHIHKETKKLINKLINVKQKEDIDDSHDAECFSDALLDCDLCNVYFDKDEHYKRHLEDQSHQRMVQFMSKMSILVKDLEYIGLSSDVNVPETFSNSIPPLYYCELCGVWVETTSRYARHAKGVTHGRIQELNTKLSNKKDGEIITLRGVSSARESHIYRSKKYCKLCTVWGATGYRRHLKDAGHVRIEKFLNSVSSEDRKFLKMYMNAQASLKVDNSTPPNYCVLCNILYSESTQYKQHLESAEHKYVKTYYPQERKDGVEKAPLTLRQNYYAMLHKQRNATSLPEAKFCEDESSSEESTESGSGTESDPQEHYCELCDFLCYSVLHYDKHLVGDQHRRMRRLLNKKFRPRADTYPCRTPRNSHPLRYKCELCEVFSSNYEKYDRHLNSAMHKKNQWLLFVLKQRLF